ncbi:MAG: putative capsular polysaccharide synthesis family protein, partial [Acidobacteria bacterium]|nr:putative capsular polysaccharide synthesis family protein [Acidobacteriota bacterium]
MSRFRKHLVRIAEAVMPRKVLVLVRALRWRRQQKIGIRRLVDQAIASPYSPVLVFVMAKTASTTIVSALQQVENLVVLQVHRINPDNLKILLHKMRGIGRSKLQTSMDILGLTIYRRIIEAGHPARIITSVREPIARNVSLYFEILDKLWQTENSHHAVDLERLLQEFPSKFDHSSTLRWFDDEFKSVLGIDVYNYDFPRDRGYLRIDTQRYQVLIMRSDLEDTTKIRCIEELLGVKNLSLTPKNVGSEKPYGEVYKKFLENVRFSEDYV